MYMNALGLSVQCPVNPKEKAVVNAQLRAYVNHEIYFFSNEKAMKRFRKDPLKYCGLLTDVVTKTRFRPTKKSPKTEYMMRPYYFTSDSTLLAFKSMPDSFAVRRGM
jgi:YHS domain-containing protein